jgi:predicted RNA-binding Zn-ribbon protein involved in translation (DUF1610 family)
MMVPTIRSRPTYPGLRPLLDARRNLLAVEGAGASAVLRLLSEAPTGFADRTEVVLTAVTPQDEVALRESGVRVHVCGDVDAVLGALERLLSAATMGTRLQAAGGEGFVGRVVRLGIDHCIDPRSVLTEHAGTLARRVQCVHCKMYTEAVTTSLYECQGCGNLLLVRDHYSRRLAAFQGVCVNAEDPSERPEPEEVYR